MTSIKSEEKAAPIEQGLLNPVTLPWHGKHLIEASAGTGKTFNITRLYLRALLEKALPIEQILVMTFSNAATQEIRGRIAETLNEAIEYWQCRLSEQETEQDTEVSDPVYQALFEQHNTHRALTQLQTAALLIDEASIYTIHGFCQQVLSTYSFDSGESLQTELKTDNATWLDTFTKDWLRSLRTKPDALAELSRFNWHTPSGFLKTFGKAITSPILLNVRDSESLAQQSEIIENTLNEHFKPLFQDTLSHVVKHTDLLYEQLVTHKKPDMQAQRELEWQALLNWLERAAPVVPTSEVNKILNGNRYRNNDAVKAVMETVKALKNELTDTLNTSQKTLTRQNEQQQALTIAYEGIKYIQAAIEAYKRTFSFVEFDDLVLSVANAVTQYPSLARELENHYPIALVDEFQDTDSAQYQMLSRIYQRSDFSTLLMIGDPKQAIYGFRGGDIFTYLAAGKEAHYQWFMDTNWRSTAAMVSAYNGLFERAEFDFDIHYHNVKASAHAKVNQALLNDAVSQSQALQFVYCDNQSDHANKDEWRQLQANYLANEVVRLLSEGEIGDKPIESKDIAILVRSVSEAKVVSQSLQRVNVTHVYLSNQQSVFASAEASELLVVLTGIYHYREHRRLNVALTSPLLGQTHEQQYSLFVEQQDVAWDTAIAKVQSLRKLWLQNGILAVIQSLIDDHLLLNHSLSPVDGLERSITNYQQLAELLQTHSVQNGLLKPEALLTWLSEQIDNPSSAGDASIQRLEKDENAVQIVTQHKSKGLEYQIVFIPFASDYKDPSKIGNTASILCQYYDENENGLVLQLGDTAEVHQQMIREGEAEAMRLLYVAVTRAMQRCYILVSPFEHSPRSALGRALSVESEHQWMESLNAFAEQNIHCSVILAESSQSITPRAHKTSPVEKTPNDDLIAPLAVSITPPQWRLKSFSSLVSSKTGWARMRAGEEKSVEAELQTILQVPFKASTDMRFVFPKGAGPGNVLHDTLEHKDFTSTEWQDDFAAQVASLDNTLNADAVKDWLNDVLAMPITLREKDRLRLRDINITSSLREAEFYFTLDKVNTEAFTSLVQAFRTQIASTFQLSLAPKTIQVGQDALTGMMHGFIDLIIEHKGRYFVADYKSNFLGDSLAHYMPSHLVHNMIEHNYDIQALIYSVALHRYLTKKIPNYRIDEHFGGALYLYLRGMSSLSEHNEGVAHLDTLVDWVEPLDVLFNGGNKP
jgi:exodeoxyribonuclease V beta subunit